MLRAMNAHRPTHHSAKVVRRRNRLSQHYFTEGKSCLVYSGRGRCVPWCSGAITLISSLCQLGGVLISEIAPVSCLVGRRTCTLAVTRLLIPAGDAELIAIIFSFFYWSEIQVNTTTQENSILLYNSYFKGRVSQNRVSSNALFKQFALHYDIIP